MTSPEHRFTQWLSATSLISMADFSVFGIGCDLCAIHRMELLYQKWGEKIGARILSPDELLKWRAKEFNCSYLAKRWAGKEAIVKALGLGFAKGIRWRDISILNNQDGKPIVNITGQTHALFENKNIQFEISLADEQGHALGFAIAFKQRE